MDLYVGAGDLGVNPADGPVVGQQVLQVKVVDPAGEAGDAEPTGRLPWAWGRCWPLSP